MIHSQIPWYKILKTVYNVLLPIPFSLQCTVVLSGGGSRYHCR